MFEEIFNDDVLNEIDRRSDAVIEQFGIDPDTNSWVDVEGVESFDNLEAPTASANLIFEVSNKCVGFCLVEVYVDNDKYVIYTYNKDILHRTTFGSGDAKIITKDQLPETVGEITHNFVKTILDKGV